MITVLLFLLVLPVTVLADNSFLEEFKNTPSIDTIMNRIKIIASIVFAVIIIGALWFRSYLKK